MGSVDMIRKSLTVGDVKRANIPKRFWDSSVDVIPDRLAHKEKITKYINELPDMMGRGVGLYLYSEENGTGKTAISVIIAKEALRCGYTVFFEESSRLKSCIMNKNVFEEGLSIEDRVKQVDLLILDDIGKEYRTASGYAESSIESLIRDRVQKMRTTVITGNVVPKNLQSIYSDDFAALLKESMIPISVVGHDFRAEKAVELQKLL
jgi:DNA replication protein DnaC